MKPCAFIRQTLESHTRGVTERAYKFAAPQYIEICRRRLLKIGLNFRSDSIKSAILLSAIFHDIGKSARKYQIQFDNDCNTSLEKIPSFYLHEISSAIISKRVCDKSNLEQPLSFFIVSSVLQHLHAMRGMDRSKTINDSKKVFTKNIEYGLFHDHASELYRIVSEISQSYEIKMVRLVPELFTDLQINEVDNLFNWIKNISQDRNFGWVKLYILFLNPVIIGDNLDAEQNRRGSQESKNRSSYMSELASAIGE